MYQDVKFATGMIFLGGLYTRYCILVRKFGYSVTKNL
jgi:hypothetical protein